MTNDQRGHRADEAHRAAQHEMASNLNLGQPAEL